MNGDRTVSPGAVKEFFASHDGLFFELQTRLRLLHEHALKTGRRRLELRLVSTHPDGKGGIGFIGDYPYTPA
ncbi:hypothetical protein OIU34_34055 [Pararhizobium sp. BT-229]|uniref:hypothetical protein n=1 Tax=Pararhizobium sp. BT-229 TaxID=2986923 RepID=UPI0021F74C90|nr:hypothetical protein [Pararhizobium sp. BT-229]MCV9966871.1 hypothetical protein [Pararhizobium sp. BT-229]